MLQTFIEHDIGLFQLRFPRKTVSKSLPLTDFRAVRKVLEPHEFATGGEEIPPTNLVDPTVWDGIMHLPDDVSIKISDHNGTRLELLYTLWGDWITAIGTPDSPDELFNCMLDAADCFQCTTFDFLHGYYRSALSNLRAALELVAIGTYGNIDPSNKEYRGWKNGAADMTFLGSLRRLHKRLGKKSGGWLLKQAEFPEKAYYDLCRFAHSRPDSSDGALWKSNGPVYNNAAIQMVFYMSLRIYAICYLLIKFARPAFTLPVDSRILFELEWLPNHGETLRAFEELYAAN